MVGVSFAIKVVLYSCSACILLITLYAKFFLLDKQNLSDCRSEPCPLPGAPQRWTKPHYHPQNSGSSCIWKTKGIFTLIILRQCTHSLPAHFIAVQPVIFPFLMGNFSYITSSQSQTICIFNLWTVNDGVLWE